MHACPAASSFHVVLEVIHGSIEIRSHPAFSLAIAAGLARPGSSLGFRQLRPRSPVASDDNLLSRRQALNELWQFRLSFFNSHVAHDKPPEWQAASLYRERAHPVTESFRWQR